MTARYCLDLPAPAQWFMDSFLLGNGRLGATLKGAMAAERIDLNLDRLWSGGPETVPRTPSPAGLLPALRAAVRRGDAATADALSRQMQGQGWTQSYQPLAGLLFGHAAGTGTGYARRLDLSQAVSVQTYAAPAGPVELTAFVSAPRDVVVMLAQGAGLLPPEQMTLDWDCPHPASTRHWTEGAVRWAQVTGRAPSLVIPPYVDADPAILYAEDEPDADGLVDRGMGFAAVAALVPVAGGAMLVIGADCGFRGAFARPSADVAALAASAEAQVRAALGHSPQALMDEHRADHAALFGRADLHLPARPEMGARDPARAELFWHFGRYLLISSSRPGGEPANLQGIWNPYRRPAWSSNHTTNINTGMNYWPAEPVALGDLAAPLVRMVQELAQAGAATARHYYGLPGTVTHHNTDLWRFTRPVQGNPVWANWTGALPWLSAHLWDHWDYGSAGEDFARDTLLPLLAQIARFQLALLVDDGAGGLIASPSSSPEHPFLGPDGQPYGVTEGAAMDQELCHELFTRLVALSDRFGEEGEVAAQARAALTRLRLPGRDASGALMEWAQPLTGAEPGHRHLSHLYGLHPGQRITGGDELAAARAALDHRMANGSGYTGWSMSWVISMAARLGDPARAAAALETLLTALATPALLVLHPYEGMPGNIVFQIDGNFGGTAGVTELLLQSAPGTIRLLPTLLPGWEDGSLTGLRARGGHRVDVRWQAGAVVAARVTAGRAGPLALDFPGTAGYDLDGEGTVTTAAPGRQGISWMAEAGRTYRLTARRG